MRQGFGPSTTNWILAGTAAWLLVLTRWQIAGAPGGLAPAPVAPAPRGDVPEQASGDRALLEQAIAGFEASRTARSQSAPDSAVPDGADVAHRLRSLLDAGEIGFRRLGSRRGGDFGIGDGPDLRVNSGHTGAMRATSLILVHEAIHSLLRGRVHPMDSEISAWAFQLRYYRELRAQGRLDSIATNRRSRRTLRALDWLDHWPAEATERGTIADYLISVLDYDHRVDVDWVIANWELVEHLSPPGKAKVIRGLLLGVDRTCSLHTEAAIALLESDPTIAAFWVSPPSWERGASTLNVWLAEQHLPESYEARLVRVRAGWQARYNARDREM